MSKTTRPQTLSNANKWHSGKGIQEEMIKQAETIKHGRVFKQVYADGHHYFKVITETEILPMIQDNKAYHEIVSSYPRRLYFDIDVKQGEKFNLNTLIQGIKDYISVDELNVYGYRTDSKQSYHITISNTYMNNDEDRLKFKDYVKFLKTKKPEIFGELGTSDSLVDTRVYSVRQAFKCIYQSKPGDENKHDIITGYPIKDLCKTFISCFIGKIKLDMFGNCNDTTLYEEFLNYDVSTLVNANKLPYGKLTKKGLPVIQVKELPSNFTQDDATNPKKLLEITPLYGACGADLGHSHRFRVLNFCYFNGLTFDDFVNWFNRPYGMDDIEKCNVNNSTNDTITRRINKLKPMWDNMKNNSEYACKINGFTKYLGNFYAEFSSAKDLQTERFIKSFNIGEQDYNIGNGYVNDEAFNTKRKVLVFNVCMGGGKTTATLRHIKDNLVSKKYGGFVWLSPRTTLCDNISARMVNEYKINHVSHLKVGADKKKLQIAKNLMICNQSLHYLDIHEHNYFDCVVIDEIETVLNSWSDGTTHKDNMQENFNVFKNILKYAKKVILLDAFITTKTINFITNITNERPHIIYSDKKPCKKVLVQNDSYEAIVKKIIDDIRNGIKPYIYYAFKTSKQTRDGILDLDYRIKRGIQELDEQEATTDKEKLSILKIDTKQYKKSLVYFAESKEKNDLGDVNIKWAEADYIITNTSITVGVNYEGLDYDKIYLLCSGSTGNPRDVIQTTMRIRKTKSDIIELFFFDTMNKDFIAYPKVFKSGDVIFDDLIVSVYSEYHADFINSFKRFCDITNYDYSGVKILTERTRLEKNKFDNDLFISKSLIEFSQVPDIDERLMEDYKGLIYARTATLTERLAIDKYFFVNNYHYLDTNQLALLWNVRGRDFIPGMKHEVIVMLLADAKINQLKDLDFNKYEPSEEILTLVKSKYSITMRDKKGSNILAKAINHILGVDCIQTKRNSSGKAGGNEFNDLFETLYGIYDAHITYHEEQRKKNNEADEYDPEKDNIIYTLDLN